MNAKLVSIALMIRGIPFPPDIERPWAKLDLSTPRLGFKLQIKGATMISSFSFGQMVIGEDQYTADLIILPDLTILPNWRRKEGHLLEIADLQSVLPLKPNLIIAGTGANGRMKMAPGLAKELSFMGIELKALATGKAVEMFNTTIIRTPDKRVSACFHLTC
ncbi:MAG: MTH938/NDUFAF3 family protein [Desulfobacterales bacterium]|nr:MTH938/NDUFAF3 family protein [Desulfobacterales bacterium]